MCEISKLLDNNRRWAADISNANPEFFNKLSEQQLPEYLWIGCSDSRVPANQIVDLMPGEIFVHRNIANLVVHTDLNCLSVLQYAVEVLKVKHVIICGHYGCGGIKAALADHNLGILSSWLSHIQDIIPKHNAYLNGLTEQQKVDKLCELNVLEQTSNVLRTAVVKNALATGQALQIHSWIYSLKNGRLRDLQALYPEWSNPSVK